VGARRSESGANHEHCARRSGANDFRQATHLRYASPLATDEPSPQRREGNATGEGAAVRAGEQAPLNSHPLTGPGGGIADGDQEAAAPAPSGLEEDPAKVEAQRAAFAQMLDQYGNPDRGETPPVGTRVKGRLIQIGDEHSFVDFGGRSEGMVETRL